MITTSSKRKLGDNLQSHNLHRRLLQPSCSGIPDRTTPALRLHGGDKFFRDPFMLVHIHKFSYPELVITMFLIPLPLVPEWLQAQTHHHYPELVITVFLIPLPIAPEWLQAQTHQTQSFSLLGIWELNPEIPLSREPLPQPRMEDFFPQIYLTLCSLNLKPSNNQVPYNNNELFYLKEVYYSHELNFLPLL